MSEYMTVEFSDIKQLAKEIKICFEGIVTNVGPEQKNKKGSQWYVEISNGDYSLEILIFKSHYHNCKAALITNNHVRVFGKTDGLTKDQTRPKILADSVSVTENKIEAKTSEKWNGLNEPELLFLRTQKIADSDFMLPQVPVNKYIVDFVVYRRDDLSPVIAIEIDGKTHITNRVNDAIRDNEIKNILGVDVHHLAAADVYEDARDAGIIE